MKKASFGHIQTAQESINWIITIISFFLAVYSTMNTVIIQNREVLAIYSVHETEYFFDGESLTYQISVLVSNNSAVPVSVVSLSMKRPISTGRWLTFDSSPTNLPLNLDANSAKEIIIPMTILLTDEQAQAIEDEFGRNEQISKPSIDDYLNSGYIEDIYHFSEHISYDDPTKIITIRTAKGTEIQYECEWTGVSFSF